MKTIALILTFILLLAGCGRTSPPEPEPAEIPQHIRITPEQAREMMAEGALILDVRNPEEFAQGHIENAVLLPLGEIGARAGEIIPDMGQVILIYCRSGRRSADAWFALAELGYVNIYDFGGIIDWPGEIVTS